MGLAMRSGDGSVVPGSTRRKLGRRAKNTKRHRPRSRISTVASKPRGRKSEVLKKLSRPLKIAHVTLIEV
jgi:hypothetical protein